MPCTSSAATSATPGDGGASPAETNFVEAAKVNLRKTPKFHLAFRSSQLGGDVSTLLPVRSTAFLIARRIQAPAPPTYGSPPGPAMLVETDSGSSASVPSGIRT